MTRAHEAGHLILLHNFMHTSTRQNWWALGRISLVVTNVVRVSRDWPGIYKGGVNTKVQDQINFKFEQPYCSRAKNWTQGVYPGVLFEDGMKE